MNNNVMFSSKTDVWATPQKFFDELNREFNFELDVCATPENAKCRRFYTKEQDGLAPFPSMVVIFGEKGGRLL